MAAGEGTDRAGRPQLIGNRVTLTNSITLSTRTTNSYLVHKHYRQRDASASKAAQFGGADFRSAAARKPCTHHRRECLTRCARVIAKAHRPYRRPPCSVNHKGMVHEVLYG
jgi:hypothetical protein